MKLISKYGIPISGFLGLFGFLIGFFAFIDLRYNDYQLLQFTATPMATNTQIVSMVLGFAIMIISKVVNDKTNR